jgi:hypothetical protein
VSFANDEEEESSSQAKGEALSLSSSSSLSHTPTRLPLNQTQKTVAAAAAEAGTPVVDVVPAATTAATTAAAVPEPAVDAAAEAVADDAAGVAADAADVASVASDVAAAAQAAPAVAADAGALKTDLTKQAQVVKETVVADANGIKAALQAAATDFEKSLAAGIEANAKAAPAPSTALAADTADASGKFDLESLVNFAQSLNLTQVKGLTDKVRLGLVEATTNGPLSEKRKKKNAHGPPPRNKKPRTQKPKQAAALKEAAGDLQLGQVDVKNLTSVLSLVSKLPGTAKGLGLDIKLPDVPAMEKIDVQQVVSLFNTAKVLIPKVNLTGLGGPESKAGDAARSVVKALLWKQKVQAASMQLATSVALGILTEGVSGMHNVSMGVAQKALQAVGMKQAAAASGLAGSMGVLKRAKAELDEELVGKLRNSTLLLNDLSLAVQKQAADGGNFASNMFVQLCNAKIDQLKLALAGKPVTPGLGEGILWTPGTLPKPVYAKAPMPRPSAECAKACAGEARSPVCTGKRQTWANECLAKCVKARIINPGACPPVVIGTA